MGSIARPRDCMTVRWSGWTWSPASTRADSTIAMPMMMAIFTNSDGWSEKPPPITIQECAPLTVEPSGLRTARMPRMDRT